MTGSVRVVTQYVGCAHGIAIEDDGSLLITDHGSRRVLRIDPGIGSSSNVTSGGNPCFAIPVAYGPAPRLNPPPTVQSATDPRGT
jgi:hypothetical protein